MTAWGDPAYSAVVFEQSAVDFGVFATDVRGALAAKPRVEVADALEHAAVEGEIAAEDRRAAFGQPARLAVIELAQKTQQFVL